jgi:hypothetical protein
MANALVARLERDGRLRESRVLPRDTADARRLLKLFEESRTLYLAERDRVRRELAEYPASDETPA